MGVLKAFVHQGLITVPTESRNPPSLTLRTARYDLNLDSFVPVGENGGIATLPLAEDEHVAALGRVGCRQTGLARTFLVLATRECLTIGRLSVENLTYEAAGMIALPRGGGDGGGEECLECWLADGPTVVAWYPSNVVTASARQEQSVPWREFERHGCPKWKADMLEGSFQRVFVAGNQVLCVSSVSTSGSSSEFVRSADFLSFSLPPDNQVDLHNRTLARVQLPLELDPCLVTCVAYVRRALGLSYEVVLGTSDGRLKCCSHSKVIMEVTLEESPLSVVVAESAHGVPVLVVSSGGMDRKVVTFFADSLHQIHSWTGIQQVVVDDLAGVGCDQMLLITQPSSTASFENYRRISLLESGSQNANDKHGSKILKFINEALAIRLQDGVKELQVAEQRRLDKMHMLTSPCNLMQSIAVQQTRGSQTGDNVDFPEDAVCMESVQLQEIYAGRCFLIINVRVTKSLPEGIHLLRPTLFATSLHGFVKSMACCLPSQGRSQRFLFSFPLKDCNFPLHIIWASEVSTGKNTASTWDLLGVEGPSKSSNACRMYTQWIHSIEDFTVSKFVGSDVPGSVGNPTAVCEKWMSLMDGAMPQDQVSALVRAVLLQSTPGGRTWESESTFKAEGGRRYAMDPVHTKIPLTSMYVQDVSLVSKSNCSTNFSDSLSNLNGPRLVETVIHFADVMLDEIQSCASGTSDACLTELQAATDRCMCHLLSSIMYNKCSH